KKYKNFGGITLEQIFEEVCKEDKQLATYFGYDNEKSLKIKDNHKIRDVKEWLSSHSNIKRVRDNPITLKWFDNDVINTNNSQHDEHDEHDKEKEQYQEKNDKKIQKKYENGLELTSYSSFSSDSHSDKGFQLKPGGRIYRITEERIKELEGENREGDD
ncbi:MAG TPA: hypothetical protein VFK40_08090, partial [Nitrososphaeraceae archaeon]|nr:hypothetical protein [Nitrososphaeraceae archaeon]